MTARLVICLLLCAALASGCRCTVAITFVGDAEAVQEAGKDYGQADLSPTLDLSLK